MSTAFVNVPLFHGMEEDGLRGLGEVFEPYEAGENEILFASGDTAKHVWLLIDGSVAVQEDGKTHIELQPISLIGELGAMTQLTRRVTAVALEPSSFLRAAGPDLVDFFSSHGKVAITFYQNLLGMAADKIRRDERRLEDMQRNLIHTQKSLKRLRNLILESPDTVVSQPAHDMLESLIAKNRRANYQIEPPMALPAEVKLPNGKRFPVLSMSRQYISVPRLAAEPGDDNWRAVLMLGGAEVPVSGEAHEARDGRSRVELDMLIDEYVVALESYLTQAQLLDIVL